MSKEGTPPDEYAAKVKSLSRQFAIPHDVIAALPLPDEIKKQIDELYRISERSHAAWLLVSKSEEELFENLRTIEAEQAQLLVTRYLEAVEKLIKVDDYYGLVSQAISSTRSALNIASQGSERLKTELDKQYELLNFAQTKFFEAMTDFLQVLHQR